MPVSPLNDSDGPLKIAIATDGEPIDDALQVVSVSVVKAINRIARAEIVVRDGDVASGSFPASEGDAFAPGASITVAAGYGDKTEQLFSGVIVGQQLSIGDDGVATLCIDCRDKAVAMSVARRNANYVEQKDSQIAATLIGQCGLDADVSASETQWRELVQYYCSDWDFLVARAEANAFVVVVDDGKVSFKPPATSAAAALKVSFGLDLLEFDGRLDARDQFASVKATAWDMKTQAIVEASAKPAALNAQGNIDSAQLAKVLAIDSFGLQTPTPLASGALKTWAEAQQQKSVLSRLRGSMLFQGSAKARIDSVIELAGCGARFNGDVYVGALRHEISDGKWTSRVDFGLAPGWSAENADLAAPAAAGLVPGIPGLHLGVVKKLEQDPDGQFRIQVSIPVMQAASDGVWARLTQFHAGSGKGAFFLPEIGDEVVLGYFNDDPSAPVVLGSLYSSKRQPPYTPADDNFKKAISTRSGLVIEYDDDKKVMTLLTPGKNTIVISDDDKSILLEDQNGNTLKLCTDGIALDSPKDIKLTAKGNIALTATGKIDIQATQDAAMQGLNVKHTAQVAFTAQGAASAELSASGQTTVKGAMVMIN